MCICIGPGEKDTQHEGTDYAFVLVYSVKTLYCTTVFTKKYWFKFQNKCILKT